MCGCHEQRVALATLQAQMQSFMRHAAASPSALQLPAHAQAPPQRRFAVEPQRLSYASASEPDVLDNWLFTLEQLFTQLGLAEFNAAGRMREAAMTWDLPTDRWWRAHAAQLQAKGTPVLTWAAFVAALQAHFVPVKDAEAATEELLRVRQRGGESMDAYLLRAAQLLVRSRGAVQDETAAQLVLSHADKARLPFAVAAARKAMRASGTPLSFAALRATLVEAALDEPILAMRGTGGGGGSQQSSSGSNSSGNSSSSGSTRSTSSSGNGTAGRGQAAHATDKKHVRVQALRRELAELTGEADMEAADGDEAQLLQAAPVGTSGGAGNGRPCSKCGGQGHGFRQCTSSKELRACLRCDVVGHVVANCPTRATRPSGTGAGAGAPPSGAGDATGAVPKAAAFKPKN